MSQQQKPKFTFETYKGIKVNYQKYFFDSIFIGKKSFQKKFKKQHIDFQNAVTQMLINKIDNAVNEVKNSNEFQALLAANQPFMEDFVARSKQGGQGTEAANAEEPETA